MTLKERRLDAGLSQMMLAAAIDVSQVAVSHWETGQAKPLKKHLRRLARVFECDAEEVMGNDGQEVESRS